MIKMWECPAISTQCHYSIFKTKGCPRQSQLRSEGGSKAGRNTKSQEQHKSAAKSVVKSSNCISMIGPQWVVVRQEESNKTNPFFSQSLVFKFKSKTATLSDEPSCSEIAVSIVWRSLLLLSLLRALSIRTSSTFLPCWLSKAWQAQWPDLPMSAQKDNTRPDKERCHFFWTSDWSQFKFKIVTVVNKTQLWMTAVRIRAWQPAYILYIYKYIYYIYKYIIYIYIWIMHHASTVLGRPRSSAQTRGTAKCPRDQCLAQLRPHSLLSCRGMYGEKPCFRPRSAWTLAQPWQAGSRSSSTGSRKIPASRWPAPCRTWEFPRRTHPSGPIWEPPASSVWNKDLKFK